VLTYYKGLGPGLGLGLATTSVLFTHTNIVLDTHIKFCQCM